MAENKPTNRERLREITDVIEQGIKELLLEAQKVYAPVFVRYVPLPPLLGKQHHAYLYAEAGRHFGSRIQ